MAPLLGVLSRLAPLGAIDDPEAPHDVAGAAVVSGDVARGHELYRLLVARASFALDPRERTRALLEAGRGCPRAWSRLFERSRALPRRGSALCFAGLRLDRARLQRARPRSHRSGGSRARARPRGLGSFVARTPARRGRARDSWRVRSCLMGSAPEPSAHDALRDPRSEGRRSRGGEPMSRSRSSCRAASFTPRSPCSSLRAILKLAEIHLRAFLADPRAEKGPWAEHARQKLANRASVRARREE